MRLRIPSQQLIEIEPIHLPFCESELDEIKRLSIRARALGTNTWHRSRKADAPGDPLKLGEW